MLRAKLVRLWIVVGLLMAVGMAVAAPAGKPIRAATSLAQADRFYAEKSYGLAAEGYRRFLKAGQVPEPRKNEIAYRVGVALGKSGRWNEAIAESLRFVREHPESVWEARGLYWLGRLYLEMPHQGWRSGDNVTRGSQPPRGEQAAELVELNEQDSRNAQDALEAARVFYGQHGEGVEREIVQLNFDLARVLESSPALARWAEKKDWRSPHDPEWKVDPSAEFSPSWPYPRKITYLYANAELLARKERVPARAAHQRLLARAAYALWLHRYRQEMAILAVRWEKEERIEIPYPYQDVSERALLRQALRDFPGDAACPKIRYLLGSWSEEIHRERDAVAEYRELIRRYPGSAWVQDARGRLQELERKGLELERGLSQLPGRPAALSIRSRNLARVHLQIFRIRPVPALMSARETKKGVDPRTFSEYLANMAVLEKLHGKPLLSLDVPTHTHGDYEAVEQHLTLPITEPGSYLVVGSAPGVRSARVLSLSGLALVQKVHRDGVLLFAADSRTGKPLAGVSVATREGWQEGNHRVGQWLQARTDADGIARIPLLRRKGRYELWVESLLYRGDEVALSDRSVVALGSENPGLYRSYLVTDRPVYRPGQTVKYHVLLMRREGGDWRPLLHRQVRVVVTTPAGEIVQKTLVPVSSFGTLNGQVPLAAGASLGEYEVGVSVPGGAAGDTSAGGNRFRVEEYKKPEFEVAITPAAERVKLGETASVKVHAEYYFGVPVPRGKVTYRVHRNEFSVAHRFPRPFDFLYENLGTGDYETSYRNGEVVTQGEATTDDHGDARISFPTAAPTQGSAEPSDASFTVEADVQDESRRVITGTGSLKATAHDVAVFLDYARGYATRGDRVEVEVATVNPSDQPVAAEGVAKVYRQPATPDGEEKLVTEFPLHTDAHGRAILAWTADTAGAFRLAFETKDGAGQEVEGSIQLWVQGPELAHGAFLQHGIEVHLQSPYLEEGQTARALLVVAKPDSTVLLTREADNAILERRLIRMSGRSQEISIPVSHRDVPNVHVVATVVRDGDVSAASEELFVPPVRRLTRVAVTADRAEYEPGQPATFRVHSVDWQGKPARSEICLAVSDASLEYIQKGYSPDVRTYFFGGRRSSSVQDEASATFTWEAAWEDRQPQRSFAQHMWGLGPGTGMLPRGAVWEEQVLLGSGESVAAHGLYIADDIRSMWADHGRRHVAANPFREGRDLKEAEASVPAKPAIIGGMARADVGGEYHGKLDMGGSSVGAGYVPAVAPPAVRSHFVDTAYWTPAVVSDPQGDATVHFQWPDNLTRWRAAAVGTTSQAQVGNADTSVVTRKELLVRLEAPRFFVQRDQVVVSAVVHNARPQSVKVRVELALGPDGCLEPAAASNEAAPVTVEVPGTGERRVDWKLRAAAIGTAKVRVAVQGGGLTDAVESSFPVLVHGVERQTAAAGMLRSEKQAELAIRVPAERRRGSSEVVVQLSPSLAGVMLDALPYLADYPYGCVEQTMSRFLPSVLLEKTLKDLGYPLSDLRKRAITTQRRAVNGRPRMQPGTAYSAPRSGPATTPQPELAERSPVWDEARLHRMLVAGLTRIAELQHADGGWGWWKDDASDPFMTAYVVDGLQKAERAGVRMDGNMLRGGVHFLRGALVQEQDLHRLTCEARVLASDPESVPRVRELLVKRVLPHRDRLSVYSNALLGTALARAGERAQAELVLRNLEGTAEIDEAAGTASWSAPERGWWYWWGDRVETNAAVLELVTALHPRDRLAQMLVRWLVENRRGSVWHSTRATALSVEALAECARQNRELAPDCTVTVDLGARFHRTFRISHENALLFDGRLVIPEAELPHTTSEPGSAIAGSLVVRKEGAGTLYYSAITRYFSLEEPIRATGSGIAVERRYFRLLPGTASGAPTYQTIADDRPNPFLLRRYELLGHGGEWAWQDDRKVGPRYQRVELHDGDPVRSGDQIEVELQLESKNDYEYLIFEDMKPAGCEPVELRSGEHGGLGICSNMELRDQKVAFFLSSLPQGKRTLTYRLRAEIPGDFHVLPTNGYAMYAPDIRALSDERPLRILDQD